MGHWEQAGDTSPAWVHTESRLLLPGLAQQGTAWHWALPLAPSAAPSISGQWHWHPEPDGIREGEPSPAAPRLRGTPHSSKAKHGCVPCCSPATQGRSGLRVGQQFLPQDQLRDNFPTAETLEPKAMSRGLGNNTAAFRAAQHKHL